MKIQLPDVNSDEVYLCGLIVPPGVQHTILVPGDAEPDSWDHQMQWARDDGFDLLDRVEYVFAYQYHRKLFQDVGYWTNTQDDDPEYAGYAWYQYFVFGNQSSYDKDTHFGARRCRRVIVQGE